MRIFLNTMAAALFAVCVQAAPGAVTPMERLAEMFRTSCVSLECRYELSVQGTVVKGEASGQVQGSAYRMKAGGFDFYCDGHVLWTLDNAAREAVIEQVDDAVAGYAANPAQVFVRLADAFDIASSSSANGKWTYVLTAKEKCGIKTAEVVMTSAGILVKGNFVLADGNRMKVEVHSMSSSDAKLLSYFRPDADFGDWVVTDLR